MKAKTNRLLCLVAVILCLSVFTTVAYAQYEEPDPTEEVITGEVTGGDIVVEVTETAEVEEDVDPQPLTPEGNMSLVDDIDGEAADAMQFITVASKNGNYFYIIVDRSGDGENSVHFLNQVDESDLMTLIDEDTTQTDVIMPSCICNDKCDYGAVNTVCNVCATDLTLCAGTVTEPDTDTEPDTEPEPEPEKGKDTSAGTIALIILVIVAAGGAGYYFKVVRPKQDAANPDEDEFADGLDDEYGYTDTELDDSEMYLPDEEDFE